MKLFKNIPTTSLHSHEVSTYKPNLEHNAQSLKLPKYFIQMYNQKNALENKHLLPIWFKGAIAWYPASETYFDESGRGEKRIPKTDNDTKVGPVPRVFAVTSERAKSITQNANAKTEEVDFCSVSSFADYRSDTSTLKNMKSENSEENEHQESTEKLSLNSLDLHKDRNSLNIFVRIPYSKTFILNINTNTQTIMSLMQLISERTKIPVQYIRLIYNNKEIQNYATEDINWLGLKDNDVIDVKLRLKGGMNETFSMDIERDGKKKLEKLYDDLLKTQQYTSGMLDESRRSRSRFVDLTSETIYQSLQYIFRNGEVDILNPEYSSVNNLFSKNNEVSNDAINEMITNIAEIKANLIQGNLDDVSINNPAIQKPIIYITAIQCRNRNMNQIISNKMQSGFDYGSHWISMVILPKNFKGLLNKVKIPKKSEQVLLFDSINSRRELPNEFKVKMTDIWNRVEQNSKGDGNIYRTFPPSLDKEASFASKAFMNQQNYNSCGYWAMFNSIMTVMTGNGEFYDSMANSSINSREQNHLAELYIREMFELYVPNLKNDEYNRPQTDNTDEKRDQTSLKKKTNIEPKLKRDGTPDRRCKQINEKRERSISEKKNIACSPVISPTGGKKVKTDQPSIISFFNKNTESTPKPDIDAQNYFNINNNAEIVTEENTLNEEIFEEALNQKKSVQSNVETNETQKQRNGLEEPTEAKNNERDDIPTSNNTNDSTKENLINTLHNELNENYLDNLRMLYGRLIQLEITDEKSRKNIDFLSRNLAIFTPGMEAQVAGLVHGTMAAYLQSSLREFQNKESQANGEENRMKVIEQRLEDMQSEIKTLTRQIESNNKHHVERIDEEAEKIDEKHPNYFKKEELYRTIEEKVEIHSKKIEEQMENLKSWTEKEFEIKNLATKSLVNREIRNIPNTNEQENSEKINELLISNVRLNDQIREQREILQKKCREIQERNNFLEERLFEETEKRREEMKRIHSLLEEASKIKNEDAPDIIRNISDEFRKLNVSNSHLVNTESQDVKALVKSIVKEQYNIERVNLQKQIDELSNGGEQLKQKLDQQDRKLKDLIQNWATEYNKNDQKAGIDLNSEMSEKIKSLVCESVEEKWKRMDIEYENPKFNSRNIQREENSKKTEAQQDNRRRYDRTQENEANQKVPKPLKIPYRGKLLLAYFRDIRRCKGDLRKLEETVKSQDFENDVQSRWKLRFIWSNQIIYPTPEEMKESEGDMDKLVEICRKREKEERQNKYRNRTPEKMKEKQDCYYEQTNSSFRRKSNEKRNGSSKREV